MKLMTKKTFELGLASVMLLSCQKAEQPAIDTANGVQTGGRKMMAVNYATFISDQCTYIRSCQRASGAIMNDAGVGNDITPYFSNIACIGLLDDPTVTNIAAVKAWMTWYMSHLNGT